MAEQIVNKTENNVVQPVVNGMMLRKRVKEGKKYVHRMLYVERPTQSKDPLHNMKRDAKRDAAQLAKTQKADVQKEIKKQMEIFDVRFILASMNKFAPRGYKFVVDGKDNRIAMQSTEIMGTQKPRGAFVSDISFDLIFCLYGDLLNGKVAGPDDSLYERIKHFPYEKPVGVAQEKHDKYMHIIENIRAWDFGMLPPFSFKSAPTKVFTNKNAILVQGIMDSGQIPPKFLGNRMHSIVNEAVFWAFRRVMLELRLSKLQQLRKTYRNHLANRAIIPGKKFGFTGQTKQPNQISPKQKKLEQRLDILINHVLPQAIYESREETVALHRQMIQLADLQPSKSPLTNLTDDTDEIKPSKKLKHQIQREIEDICTGVAQKQNVEKIQSDIRKTAQIINGIPKQELQPARDLMPNVFYTEGNPEHLRKIDQNASVLKQILWLTLGRVSKTK